jgi:hypothetical protein
MGGIDAGCTERNSCSSSNRDVGKIQTLLPPPSLQVMFSMPHCQCFQLGSGVAQIYTSPSIPLSYMTSVPSFLID